MEMISDVVSRYDGRRFRSSRIIRESTIPRTLVVSKPSASTSPGRAGGSWWKAEAAEMGRMVKRPMSPVSVVVLSMLSNGPGDSRMAAFSLTLLRGR